MATTQKQTFGFDTLNDVLAWPDPTYLVDGVLSDDSLAVLYGPSGTGKSFVVIDLMFHVALGRPWLGRETAQGLAVYIFGEGGAGIKQRASAWLQDHGIEGLPEEHLLLSQEVLNLSDGNAVADFIRRLRLWAVVNAKRVRLVVFDTLARCAEGVDENSNRDLGIVVANANTIRKSFGATVLVVHHTGKDTDRGMRGGSALPGALDTSLALSKGSSNVLEMMVEKQKDGPDGFGFSFEREVVQLPDQRTSCVVRYSGESTKPANDNSSPKTGRAALKNDGQRAMLDIVEKLGAGGQYVPWGDIRHAMNAAGHKTDRPSDCVDWRKRLEALALISFDGANVKRLP